MGGGGGIGSEGGREGVVGGMREGETVGFLKFLETPSGFCLAPSCYRSHSCRVFLNQVSGWGS